MQQNITFEQASKDLTEILAMLQDENTPLDEALRLYAKAADTIAACNDILQDAQLQVEEINTKLQESEKENDV